MLFANRIRRPGASAPALRISPPRALSIAAGAGPLTTAVLYCSDGGSDDRASISREPARVADLLEVRGDQGHVPRQLAPPQRAAGPLPRLWHYLHGVRQEAKDTQ